MSEDTDQSSPVSSSRPKPQRRSSTREIVKERWDKIRKHVLNPEDKNADKNSKVNIQQTDIDPELLKVQIEWADLLMHDDIQVFKPLQCGDLTQSQLATVAASWFNDGVLGWKIDYPQNERQLKCYILTRSRRFLQIYTFFFFLHLFTPFFGQPNCAWDDVVNQRSIDLYYTESGRYMSQFAINFIGFICVVLYCFEISMRLYVNNSFWGSSNAHVLPWYKDKWVFIRLVCCIVLSIDILIYIFTLRPVRFGRALLPLIYISRRNSLRQMLHGLWLAFLNAFGIISFLVAAVLLWTFAGYILFRGVDVTTYSDIYENLYVNITEAQEQHLNRFDTPHEAFLTSLFAATSRSFNILVLNPYFPVTEASTVYFVALTIIADLIIINLMIAFGNRQYRIFASKLFKRQLRNRRQAFVSIHSVLADKNGNISRATWLEFCSKCQGKYRIRKKMADTIFTLECENDPLKPNYDTIDCMGLFRLSALLSSRVKMDANKINDTSTESGDSGMTNNPMHKSSRSSEAKESATGEIQQKSVLSLLFLPVTPEGDDSDEDILGTSNKGNDDKDNDDEDGDDEAELGLEELENAQSNATSLKEKIRIFCKLQANRLTRWTITVNTPAVPFIWPHQEQFQVEPFNSFMVFIKFFLVVQCGVITSGVEVKEWIIVGWFIMCFLWFEMITKRFAWGRSKYLRRSGFGYTAVVNVVTTILMILIGTNDIKYSSPEFILYMILQSSRLLLLFRYLADSNAFISLFPLLYRIFFIIFSIFYCFSVIGYNRLCNVFRESNIEDDAVDDANTWLNFQSMFNFDSLIHTMFTCFYVSTLGNWTWIMNAAAQTEPFPSLFFFTTIRLLFTVVVYPILFSFLITGYINRRNKDEKAKGSKSDDLKGLENKLLNFHANDEQPKEFKFERQLKNMESPQDVNDALHRAVEVVFEKRYVGGEGSISLFDRDSDSLSTDSLHASTSSDPRSDTRASKKIKSVAKLWMSQDKLTVKEMFDSYSNGALMGGSEAHNSRSRTSTTDALKSKKTHESMMSHWSGGQEALTAEEKAKKKEMILKKLLEVTMEKIAAERQDIYDLNSKIFNLQRMYI